MTEASGFDLSTLLLSVELGRKVDLTTREGLRPLLRADIEREAIRVF